MLKRLGVGLLLSLSITPLLMLIYFEVSKIIHKDGLLTY